MKNIKCVLTKVLTVIFVILLIVATVLLVKQKKTKSENFENTSDSYESRLAVINVFDKNLNKNPTPKEITHYSKFKNEHDILKQVNKDFKNKKNKKENYEDKAVSEKDVKEYVKKKEENKSNKNSDNDSDSDSDSDTESVDSKDSDEDDEAIAVSSDTHSSIPKDELKQIKKHLSETLNIVNAHV